MGFLVYNMINPIYGKRAANSVSAFADMYGSTEIPITVYSGGKDSFARGFSLKNFPEIQQVELPRM